MRKLYSIELIEAKQWIQESAKPPLVLTLRNYRNLSKKKLSALGDNGKHWSLVDVFHGVSLFLQLYSLVPDRQIKRLLRLVGMLRAFVYFEVIEQSSPKLPQNGQTKLEWV